MRLESHIEKWASGVLGAVCLVLLIGLVFQFGGVRAGGPRPTMPSIESGRSSRLRAASGPGSDDLSRYDPVVRWDLLKELQSRPLPDIRRDPFELDVPRVAAQPAQPAPTPPTEPPGPPPVPLAGMGFAEKAGGVREAYVSDGEEVYVVHEGESFANRFKVLHITPALVEVEDETLHRTVELPFPQ